MRTKIGILIIAFILTLFGCSETWDEYYNKQSETINMNVWDAIKGRSELSRFVELMVKFKYDTLFRNNVTYTIFAPDNSAIEKLLQTEDIGITILNYHISKQFILPVDIQGKRKIQTLADKYSTFENVNGKSLYDGTILNYESPLYLNGKFFIMNEVALPKLNLYEFFKKNNPYLTNYIDKKDSIILDKEKSRPIGFDAKGNTVYDTVAIKLNQFELKYFPVSKEYRKRTATFVYPRLANYENALTVMAQKLGGSYQSYKDIPVKWQEDILIPHLVKHGTFLNMLEVSEFKSTDVLTSRKKYNMVNINGDSIVVNYAPTDRYLCSNGYEYDYSNFVIPDSLYSGTDKFEGEWLARQSGINQYAWRENVSVTTTSTITIPVMNNYIKGLSNDSILLVNFIKGYKGTYNLQFNVKSLFPRKYQMIISTNMDYGGIYDIYVNDLLVKTFDYGDYLKTKGIIKSVTGKNFVPTGRYNKFDFYVNNITEFSKPLIRFEYKGPGSAPNNGLFIDVIEFIPAP